MQTKFSLRKQKRGHRVADIAVNVTVIVNTHSDV
jgi:hypothetical protein